MTTPGSIRLFWYRGACHTFYGEGSHQGLQRINPSAIYPLIIVTSIVIVDNVRTLLF